MTTANKLCRFCERYNRLLLISIFVVGLLIRLPWLGSDFNITADMSILRGWVVHLQENGLTAFYEGAGVRAYPPLSTYLFAAAGWLADTLSVSAMPDESLLNGLIKFPAILADVGTAALLVWQARKQSAVWSILIAALYLLNPAIWYVSVYWGQTDAIYIFFLVAALILLAQGAVIPAWACYALSLGTKLQGLPFVFLILTWTWVQHGRQALLKGLAASGVTGTLLVLPWLLNGRILSLIEAVISSSSRVVQSAYNFWFLLLGERAGTADAVHKPGSLPVSYQAISLVLFFAVVFFVVFLIVRYKEQLSLSVAAVVLSLAAFLFRPDMRERYLFPVLPLLLWAANQRRSLLWLYLLLSATWLFNLVTIASFALAVWTNLIAWERPYPALINILKTVASFVSAIHLAIFVYLSWLLDKTAGLAQQE